MKFEYPEDADEQLKDFVGGYMHEFKVGEYQYCHIQRFDHPEDAELVYEAIKFELGSFCAPTVLPHFSLAGHCYLIYLAGGESVHQIAESYEIYESRSFMGGKSKALFLTDLFKHMITDIISTVRQLMDTRVRACLEVKYLYGVHYGCAGLHALRGKFMCYETVRDKDEEDIYEVIEGLKRLLWEIFELSKIDGAPAAEFKIFLDNFQLCPHKEMFDNVVFATKTQRMYFINEMVEFFKNRSSEINEDEEIIGAFGKDWESKLREHPDLNLLLVEPEHQSKKIRLSPERNTMECIDTISKLYAEFSDNKATNENIKLEDDGQLVEVIQYIFPLHTAALAKKALKLGHRFPPLSFEPPWGSVFEFPEVSDSESDVSGSEMEPDPSDICRALFLEAVSKLGSVTVSF